jgi:hypothetical protein
MEVETVKRLATLAVAALMLSGTAFAARPARNVSARRHPNIASAQRLCREAYDKVLAAQKANEWDLQGHARKAKELLEQASDELKEAALAANRR